MDSPQKVRKVKIRDLEAIKNIEEECSLSSWSLSEYKKEIYRGDSVFYVFEDSFKIRGFLLARLIMLDSYTPFHQRYEKVLKNTPEELEKYGSNEIEIYNIGIRKNYRRMNAGSMLLKQLLEIAGLKKVSKIWLDVRVSNTVAINFYRSHGFKISQKRKNFYTYPVEDSFVMYLAV